MDHAPGCGGPGGACSSDMPSPPSAHNMVNGKVMLVAVLVLVGVVLFILCLHIYAKWFWRRQGGTMVASDGTYRTLSWRRRVQDGAVPATQVVQSMGLERAVVEALPSFVYSGEEAKERMECAVCLEEFEDGEKGRTLPNCGHGFHLDCIDMWLHSHSTCPLCRTSAGPEEDAKQSEAVVEVPEEAAVVGDVDAPFMAAMRATRRQQRLSRGQSMAANSLPRTSEEHDEENHAQTEESTPTSAPDTDFAAAVSQQSLKEYETPATLGSSIRAPFQVTIDIPRAGVANSSFSNAGNVLSPMARASASFRRLLSRGKSVVTPQSPDESGPSTSPRPPPSV